MKNIFKLFVIFCGCLFICVSSCKKTDEPAPKNNTTVREMNAKEKEMVGHWKLYETRDTSWRYANGMLFEMFPDSQLSFSVSQYLLLEAENASEEIRKMYPNSLRCSHSMDGIPVQTGWSANESGRLYIGNESLSVIFADPQKLTLRYEINQVSSGNGVRIYEYYYFRK